MGIVVEPAQLESGALNRYSTCWLPAETMSKVLVVEGYRVLGGPERAAQVAKGYVKEFTRHPSDVLVNLNELRQRDISTDTTLLVGTVRLRAHCAVLIACR